MFFRSQVEKKKRLNKLLASAIASGVLSTTLLAGGVSADELSPVSDEGDIQTEAAQNEQTETQESSLNTESLTKVDNETTLEDDAENISETNEASPKVVPYKSDEPTDELFPEYDPSKPYILLEDVNGTGAGIIAVRKGLTYQQLKVKLAEDWAWNKIALYTIGAPNNDRLRPILVLVEDPNHIMSIMDFLVKDELAGYFEEHIDEIGTDLTNIDSYRGDLLIVAAILPPYEDNPVEFSEEQPITILDTSIARVEVDGVKSELVATLQSDAAKQELISSVQSTITSLLGTSQKLDATTVAKFEIAVSLLVKENNVNEAVKLTSSFIKVLEQQKVSPNALKSYMNELLTSLENKDDRQTFLKTLVEQLEKDQVDVSVFKEISNELK